MTGEQIGYYEQFFISAITLYLCSILNALQERREERRKRVHDGNLDEHQIEYHELQAWQKFWEAESPRLLLYSCLHGTVDIVKYFITKYVSPVTK